MPDELDVIPPAPQFGAPAPADAMQPPFPAPQGVPPPAAPYGDYQPPPPYPVASSGNGIGIAGGVCGIVAVVLCEHLCDKQQQAHEK